MFLRKRLMFGWCQMIDGSQLTRCCRITVVWVDPATTTLLRRWSCCSSDVTSVADQRFASVTLPIPLSFLRRCPAVQLPTLLWSLFDRSRILTDSVVELNRQFYHTLVITDFHQFKSYRSLASRWVVRLDDVMDSSGLWLAGRINVDEMLFSPDEINNYYSIYTMTTSPYLYTLFIVDYIQLLAYVTIATQVI